MTDTNYIASPNTQPINDANVTNYNLYKEVTETDPITGEEFTHNVSIGIYTLSSLQNSNTNLQAQIDDNNSKIDAINNLIGGESAQDQASAIKARLTGGLKTN
jgi:hypothetical protein